MERTPANDCFRRVDTREEAPVKWGCMHCHKLTAPDKEVDAGDTRVEKDNGVDYEGDGVPECIKGAALLYFHRHVPLGRCRSIQPKHGHRNDPWPIQQNSANVRIPSLLLDKTQFNMAFIASL